MSPQPAGPRRALPRALRGLRASRRRCAQDAMRNAHISSTRPATAATRASRQAVLAACGASSAGTRADKRALISQRRAERKELFDPPRGALGCGGVFGCSSTSTACLFLDIDGVLNSPLYVAPRRGRRSRDRRGLARVRRVGGSSPKLAEFTRAAPRRPRARSTWRCSSSHARGGSSRTRTTARRSPLSGRTASSRERAAPRDRRRRAALRDFVDLVDEAHARSPDDMAAWLRTPSSPTPILCAADEPFRLTRAKPDLGRSQSCRPCCNAGDNADVVDPGAGRRGRRRRRRRGGGAAARRARARRRRSESARRQRGARVRRTRPRRRSSSSLSASGRGGAIGLLVRRRPTVPPRRTESPSRRPWPSSTAALLHRLALKGAQRRRDHSRLCSRSGYSACSVESVSKSPPRRNLLLARRLTAPRRRRA